MLEGDSNMGIFRRTPLQASTYFFVEAASFFTAQEIRTVRQSHPPDINHPQ